MIWITVAVTVLLFIYLLAALLRPEWFYPAEGFLMLQVWLLPLLIVGAAVALAVPLGRYLAWILDGPRRPGRLLGWVERNLDTGPQDWKHYCLALLGFNVAAFVIGFLILALQPL